MPRSHDHMKMNHLDNDYRAMSADRDREAEALEWAEAAIADGIPDDAREQHAVMGRSTMPVSNPAPKPPRTRAEIGDELARMFAAQEPDPAVADLTDDELMERVDVEIAATRVDRHIENRRYE